MKYEQWNNPKERIEADGACNGRHLNIFNRFDVIGIL